MSNQIYQNTFLGRKKHALRQRRYILRQQEKIKLKKNKVTDQGSALISQHDLLLITGNDNKKTMNEPMHCCFCKKSVAPYLRNGYLRHTQRPKENKLLHFNDTG